MPNENGPCVIFGGKREQFRDSRREVRLGGDIYLGFGRYHRQLASKNTSQYREPSHPRLPTALAESALRRPLIFTNSLSGQLGNFEFDHSHCKAIDSNELANLLVPGGTGAFM